MREWKFIGVCPDSQRFEIESVNVWDHKWIRQPGQTAQVKDPLYNQDFHFAVYTISALNKAIIFAAGEFSNCMWGFYVPAGN